MDVDDTQDIDRSRMMLAITDSGVDEMCRDRPVGRKDQVMRVIGKFPELPYDELRYLFNMSSKENKRIVHDDGGSLFREIYDNWHQIIEEYMRFEYVRVATPLNPPKFPRSFF